VTEKPGHGRNVFVYQVETTAGQQSVVSLIAPHVAFQTGLHAEAILGVLAPGSDGVITPEGFQQNPAFVEYLGTLIAEHIFDVEGVRREAQRQGEGYVYLLDARTPTPAGAVSPSDVIGAVAVRDRELVAGSYRHNPNHRLLTAEGFFVLPLELETLLQNDIHTRRGPSAGA
jgi:hypothetical protein